MVMIHLSKYQRRLLKHAHVQRRAGMTDMHNTTDHASWQPIKTWKQANQIKHYIKYHKNTSMVTDMCLRRPHIVMDGI